MFSEKQRKKKCLPKTIDSLRNKTYNLVNIKTKETTMLRDEKTPKKQNVKIDLEGR